MPTYTEDQIERIVELRMDGLDARLMNGTLSQAEYDDKTRRLSRWADQLPRRA